MYNADTVAGSRPKRQQERWKEARILCLPRYCMYEYCCSVSGQVKKYVHERSCVRCLPEEYRPTPLLSRAALETLQKLRDGQKK